LSLINAWASPSAMRIQEGGHPPPCSWNGG
jgi:hypothetical protein